MPGRIAQTTGVLFSWPAGCYLTVGDREGFNGGRVPSARIAEPRRKSTAPVLVTLRRDGLPHAEREEWLRRQGIDPAQPGWESLLRDRPAAEQQAFRRFLSDRWNDHLDELHGACLLRRPELARIVSASLRHFDAERYLLADFVVMPNHVHILAAFSTDETMLRQCELWKHFTARQINQAVGRLGRFWEQDAFDHLVRSPEEFARLRRYIAENPATAGLRPGDYLYYRKDPIA